MSRRLLTEDVLGAYRDALRGGAAPDGAAVVVRYVVLRGIARGGDLPFEDVDGFGATADDAIDMAVAYGASTLADVLADRRAVPAATVARRMAGECSVVRVVLTVEQAERLDGWLAGRVAAAA